MNRKVIWVLFLLLFMFHQDFWWWDDASLIFGFLPIGLAYHAAFSLSCGLLGWLAIKFAWPYKLQQFAEENTTGEERD